MTTATAFFYLMVRLPMSAFGLTVTAWVGAVATVSFVSLPALVMRECFLDDAESHPLLGWWLCCLPLHLIFLVLAQLSVWNSLKLPSVHPLGGKSW
jgi:hypothetical protein